MPTINPNSTRATPWNPASLPEGTLSQELPPPVPGPGKHPVNFCKITPRRLVIGCAAALGVAGLYLYTRGPGYTQGTRVAVLSPDVPQAVVTEALAFATPTPTPQLVVPATANNTFRILPFPVEPQQK